ncbi:unnamed protein product [Lampetra planeri]
MSATVATASFERGDDAEARDATMAKAADAIDIPPPSLYPPARARSGCCCTRDSATLVQQNPSTISLHNIPPQYPSTVQGSHFLAAFI